MYQNRVVQSHLLAQLVDLLLRGQFSKDQTGRITLRHFHDQKNQQCYAEDNGDQL